MPTVVEVKIAGADVAAASKSVTFTSPGQPDAGNLIVGFAGRFPTVSPGDAIVWSAPSGMGDIALNHVAGNMGVEAASKTASGSSETTMTITPSASRATALCAINISGAGALTTSGTANSGGTAQDGLTVTAGAAVAVDGSLAIACFVRRGKLNGGVTTYTATGWTEIAKAWDGVSPADECEMVVLTKTVNVADGTVSFVLADTASDSNHAGVLLIFPPDNASPTVSDPGDIRTGLGYEKPIGTLVTIADTNTNLSTIRYVSPSGKLVFNITASGTGSVSAGTSGSSDVTITAGNQADLLATHALTTMESVAEGTDASVQIIATDAVAASASATFSVQVGRMYLSGTHAGLQAKLTELVLGDAVEESATVTVTAYDSGARTGQKVATVTWSATAAPDPPTGLGVDAIGPGTINLSWDAPVNPGSSAITGYLIERETAGSGIFEVVVANTGNTQTTYTDHVAQASTLYAYRISAINDVGTGSPSAVVSDTTLSTSAPGELQVGPISNTEIGLIWNPPMGTGTILGYVIERESPAHGPGEDNTFATVATIGLVVSYLDENLTPGTQYNYRIRAIYQYVGVGVPSNEASATTYDAPSAPVLVSVVAASESQLTLTWTAPTVLNGANVIGYQIERETGVGNGWTTIVVNTGTTNVVRTDGGLFAAQEYNYRIAAISIYGIGLVSNEVAGTTSSPAVVPGVPRNVLARAFTNGSIVVTWDRPTNTGGSAITGYKIERETPAGSNDWTVYVANTGNAVGMFTDWNVIRGESYAYRIYAINDQGTSAVSSDDGAGASPPDRRQDSRVRGVPRVEFGSDVPDIGIGQFPWNQY